VATRNQFPQVCENPDCSNETMYLVDNLQDPVFVCKACATAMEYLAAELHSDLVLVEVTELDSEDC